MAGNNDDHSSIKLMGFMIHHGKKEVAKETEPSGSKEVAKNSTKPSSSMSSSMSKVVAKETEPSGSKEVAKGSTKPSSSVSSSMSKDPGPSSFKAASLYEKKLLMLAHLAYADVEKKWKRVKEDARYIYFAKRDSRSLNLQYNWLVKNGYSIVDGELVVPPDDEGVASKEVPSGHFVINKYSTHNVNKKMLSGKINEVDVSGEKEIVAEPRRDITELIASGREKLASVPSGGGAPMAVAASGGGGAASQQKKEEKVEEKEESVDATTEDVKTAEQKKEEKVEEKEESVDATTEDVKTDAPEQKKEEKVEEKEEKDVNTAAGSSLSGEQLVLSKINGMIDSVEEQIISGVRSEIAKLKSMVAEEVGKMFKKNA